MESLYEPLNHEMGKIIEKLNGRLLLEPSPFCLFYDEIWGLLCRQLHHQLYGDLQRGR